MTKIRRVHWSIEEIEEMPVEEIIKKLESFGIRFSTTEFLKQTSHYLSAAKLADECYDNHTAFGLDEDFVWMAIMALWKKLAPEKTNVEMINDWMQEGYDMLENKETKKTVDLWLKVWDEINGLVPEKVSFVRDADELCLMTQSIFNWSQDLVRELHNVSLENPDYWGKGVSYCDEFCKRFKDDYFQMQFAGYKARFLYESDKKEEAIKIFEDLLEKYPDEENVYYGYANTVESETERVYLLAINRGIKDKGIVRNLTRHYKEKGQHEKVKMIGGIIEEGANKRTRNFNPDMHTLAELCKEKGTGITAINDTNREAFFPLLLAIEEKILNHDYPELQDKDVIESLKRVRDNSFVEKAVFDKLGEEIIRHIKRVLALNNYDRRDVSLSISCILNSVKLHKSVGGKRGYLDFIKDQFRQMRLER